MRVEVNGVAVAAQDSGHCTYEAFPRFSGKGQFLTPCKLPLDEKKAPAPTRKCLIFLPRG